MAIRVYQIAKEYSRSSEEVIDILRDAGIKVSSQTSALDEHALHTIRTKLGTFKLTVVDGETESAVARKATQAEPAPPAKKTSRKKKAVAKKEPPRPRLKVRVIKKHEDGPGSINQEIAPEEPKEAPTKPERPKLHRPLLQRSRTRQRNIHERIAHIAHKTHALTEKEAPRSSVPLKQGATFQTADNRAKPSDRLPGKRKEKPFLANKTSANTPPRGGRPNRGQRATAPMASFINNKQPTPPPKPGVRYHKGGPGRPLPRKNKKKRKRREHIEKIRPIAVSKVELPENELGIIMLSEGVTVKELAEKVNRKAKDIIKRLFEKSIMATLNDVLEDELALEIAKDFGYEAEIVSFEEDLQLREDDKLITEEQEEGERTPRAPIVTIMGHVDHGKTTLLDAIRSTKVADREAGGITQHIGAYSVDLNDQNIVFLDTPGHEAFTKMRARGASVTDIVILVVAADDGVKPQTIEAISHAKNARVPIIVCINKIDKPDANPDKVKQMLTEHELIIEEFGGDSPCVQVSAKTGEGIEELLEMILLVAELQDISANYHRKGQGTVIEAKLDRGRGPVATLIVQDGVIKIGDYFITGSTYGKIRGMHGDFGQKLETAPPSTPVEILGIQEVPSAGDSFMVVQDEATARQISGFRKEKAREDQFRHQKHTSLDQLFSSLGKNEVKDFHLIIKADVQGSVEGLAFALGKLVSKKVQLRFVHQGVGNVTENDVLLAVAADAIIIGFNVKTERKALALANKETIEIRDYTVIYEVVNDIEAAMLGLMAPELEEREIGKAYVKQVFSVNKLGKVAGCYVENGIVRRDAHVRVFRDSKELYDGRLQTLKRFRDDVNEVKSGYECGIGIKGFSDLEEQDQMVFYAMEEIKPTSL